MIELACPDSCSYLNSARAEARDREARLRIKESQAGGSLDLGMNERSMAAAYLTDQAIVRAVRNSNGSSISRINDQDVLAAVENAIKNLETEESGLIYEHRDLTGSVRELSQSIRQGFDEAFNQELPEARPRRSELIRALKYVRDAIRAHTLRENADPQSYIRFVSLFCSWPQEDTKPLIIE
jgi:hypothetical protein